jgi:predicted phage gp36 major capsid-like protein
MSIEKVLEKVDAIGVQNQAAIDAVKAEALAKVEEAKNEFTEKVTALETKLSEVNSAAIIRTPAKSVRQDVNRSVREQLAKFVKKGKMEKELMIFADESQYSAYLNEASALTGSGAGVGGRTAYDPVFHKLRLINPMRGLSRNVTTEGATYQFRAKTGNAGAAWGYAIQNNGAATTESTNIWQLTLQDLNVQFPIRTAALDDIDGLEANVVDDMLQEFSEQEGLSMIQNNDQGATTLPYGGSNGLRGLDQYGGANATYTGGTISVASFGSSGTGSTSGLHNIATYDQLTTNGATVGAANVTYQDIVEFVALLPQEYWSNNTKFLMNPIFMAQIRGLKDNNGTPVFERMNPLETDGIVGRLLGFDVVVNKYVDSPYSSTSTAGTTSLYPMWFGQWERFHTIVDRLNMVLRRYDQTLPGYITFYGEKRLCCSILDPYAGIRYRSTATAT